MNEESGEATSHTASNERDSPRLEAARENLLPIIKSMKGHEIIYRCRVPWLVCIESLDITDEGFAATAVSIQELVQKPSFRFPDKFEFGAAWDQLRKIGITIQLPMVTDHFFPDPVLAAKVKSAFGRNALREEVEEIFAASNEESRELVDG